MHHSSVFERPLRQTGGLGVALLACLGAQAQAPTPEQVAAAAAAMVVTDTTTYNAGVLIRDGKLQATPAAADAVSGIPGDNSATKLSITSGAKDFNGVLVKGPGSVYTLSNTRIRLSGNGSNDFVGLAAAVMADGGATLVLRHVDIQTTGVISPAAVNTNGSTLKVYDSTLVSTGGPLPANYEPKIGAGMMTPPDGLSIGGTARATIALNKSESYFYRTKIVADGWGALSSDMSNDYLYLEANECDIQVTGKGYGIYADWGGHVVINASKLASGVFGGIVAGAARMELNGVTSQSGRSTVMLHSVMGKVTDIGQLTLHGGTHSADDAVVLVRSANADITLDETALHSKKGVLVQSVVNPDAFATKVTGRAPGIRVLVRDSRLQGDVLHEDGQRRMAVTLVGSQLRGAIRGASLSLDLRSQWTATADSQVTLVNNGDVARIRANRGVTVTVAPAVDGPALEGPRALAGGGTLVVAAR